MLNLRNKYEREECCGVATKNRIECTAMENREVAAGRDYIELLSLFKKLKKEDKQKVNSWIESLLSAP